MVRYCSTSCPFTLYSPIKTHEWAQVDDHLIGLRISLLLHVSCEPCGPRNRASDPRLLDKHTLVCKDLSSNIYFFDWQAQSTSHSRKFIYIGAPQSTTIARGTWISATFWHKVPFSVLRHSKRNGACLCAVIVCLHSGQRSGPPVSPCRYQVNLPAACELTTEAHDTTSVEITLAMVVAQVPVLSIDRVLP